MTHVLIFLFGEDDTQIVSVGDWRSEAVGQKQTLEPGRAKTYIKVDILMTPVGHHLIIFANAIEIPARNDTNADDGSAERSVAYEIGFCHKVRLLHKFDETRTQHHVGIDKCKYVLPIVRHQKL